MNIRKPPNKAVFSYPKTERSDEMNIEIRAESVNITGYVNVTGKYSKPIMTPHGKCIEVIEERAFEKALQKSGNITVELDHDNTHIYACTLDGTLELHEDNIGLHAEVTITDKNIIEIARKGRIKGWSFGMYDIEDELEQRADDLPIRHVKSFALDHISLIKDKTPAYSATSVELRGYGAIEMRSMGISPKYSEKYDYSQYYERIENL